MIETWRRHYNDVRPHSSLGYLTPNEFRDEEGDDNNPNPERPFSSNPLVRRTQAGQLVLRTKHLADTWSFDV